ncbi:MAG TPA: Na(+)/H(+) antiporter subunit B [Bacteroidales bacterium]|jgi:multicomponent Na+:H+ antiporter subunit B|nr:Na(+)/H(+) antiporter subunit B [Bacteroidales bacterium]
MNSTLLQIASKYVQWLLILVAVIALFRGHNYPGGGFIGGLLAGLAIVYRGFAFSMSEARKQLPLSPEIIIAIGLFFVVASFMPALFTGSPLMKGEWYKLQLGFTELKLGSPFIFDIGVFFTVIGVAISFVFSLNKKE